MKTATILLSTINDVKSFVNIVSKYDFDVDLTSGRYAIDAKSIMGIFSLDLSKPIKLEAHTDDGAAFFAELERFIVK
ncbi:HPr family phosphocarrier protein [Massiliimalia timonensis]|uniref:HPr family phosphocarrier protein n=1 Tax=Massiliimalia timonensis TaxID=1987501 RepID=A0A8J6P4B1_9FIRM|nr:HPr family phosphocarrier protein [Massiliimalia timonensis]MBC8610998.1 HPr family phosphocarrier protein [Massiliimalia timonensis]MBS7174818.1 HPr family phosphocarrier protein [Clostridiales bacterium]SCH11559.1 PTS HPr component phosphorylation site [uncultured Clostridium sp.]